MSSRYLVLRVLLAHVLLAGSLVARTWTDSKGRTLEADFVRLQDNRVVLQQAGGKSLEVPLSNFSADDQEFVRRQSAPGALPQPVMPAQPGMPALPGGDYRDWTDHGGRSIMAKLERVQGNAVSLVTREGQSLSLPTINLSAGDQQYVNEQVRLRGAELGAVANAPTSMPGMPPMASPSMPMATSSMPMTSPPSVPMATPSMPMSMPSIPAPNMPMSRPNFPMSSPMQMQQVFTCSKCNKEVPGNLKAGDSCPHCGAFFAFAENSNGSRTHASPPSSFHVSGRGISGLIKLAIFVVVGIASVVGWVIKKMSGGE